MIRIYPLEGRVFGSQCGFTGCVIRLQNIHEESFRERYKNFYKICESREKYRDKHE